MNRRFLILAVLLIVILAGCKKVDYTSKVDYHPTKGPSLASVSVTEWGDFQCPACGQAYFNLKPVWEKYGDKVKVEYRHFPLTSIHPYAFVAAQASECAADQDAFWPYHDIMYENQAKLKKADLIDYAGQLKLDTALFTACLDSRAKADTVRNDMREADKLGLNSTPTFFLNGVKLENWADLGTRLDQLFATSTSSN